MKSCAGILFYTPPRLPPSGSLAARSITMAANSASRCRRPPVFCPEMSGALTREKSVQPELRKCDPGYFDLVILEHVT